MIHGHSEDDAQRACAKLRKTCRRADSHDQSRDLDRHRGTARRSDRLSASHAPAEGRRPSRYLAFGALVALFNAPLIGASSRCRYARCWPPPRSTWAGRKQSLGRSI
ncbi:hypothetical protein Sala_2542 [Sphingopyxis alaskensis RB2256]|uniref:Uncharacterized protein n=1 Tax=Sphingopyxis alaskensis (strain DSM 13593 / LMG 18877 / RB2256) TaxID=317655 RepID=Q1GQ24_SPHAL|nr:hypothetical protein Sala_2542 [Sphingopyxis alaskensis RB2256]